MAYQFLEKPVRARLDNKLIVEIYRRFQVIFDDVVNDPIAVLSLPECPKPFDSHPTDRFSSVSLIEPEQSEQSYNVWTITVTYSRNSLDYENAKENPLDRRPKVEWDTVEYQRPFIYDANGKIVTNSAGDPFVPAYQIEDNRVVVSMTVNQLYVPTYILDYRNKINSAPFSIEGIAIPAQCAKTKRIHVGPWQNELGVLYRPVTISLELRESQGPMNVSTGVGLGNSFPGLTVPGFQVALQDAGYYEINGATRQKILVNGLEPSQPALLDGSGAALITPITIGSEFFRVFDGFQTRDFSVFGFPP